MDSGRDPDPKHWIKVNEGTMVLILDVNSDKGAHVRSILLYLIWYRHLIKSRAVANREFFSLQAINDLSYNLEYKYRALYIYCLRDQFRIRIRVQSGSGLFLHLACLRFFVAMA